MRQFGPRPTLASYSGRRLGFGCGVSGASIARRSLALSLSSYGGRMLQATNCAPAHVVLIAAEKARPSSVQAGPVIISASICFRPGAPTRCATMILLAHSDSRIHPRAAVWVPHRLSLRPIAIWCGPHIHRRRTIVTRRGNRSPNDRSGSETAYQSIRGEGPLATSIQLSGVQTLRWRLFDRWRLWRLVNHPVIHFDPK